MSQEQPPVRSRRELRQARDERLETKQQAGTPGPGAVPAATKPASKPSAAKPAEPAPAEITGRIRRVAEGPVDSVPAPSSAERSSQVRARDRATLRTIKELAEKEGHLAPGGAPTRRQLRLLQLAAETAPATQANLIVPASPRTRATPVVAQPGANPGARPGTGKDSPAKGSAGPGQAAKGTGKDADGGAARPGGQPPEGITVEQALAARELLAGQAQNQIKKMAHIAATDPDAVDPAVLAEQIALAERTAVLNRRAAAKQKLAEQTSQPAPLRNAPSTASNLAMVTPLEFVEVPGVERPVMKRPATSYVPVVTNPGPRVENPRKSGGRRPGLSRQRGSGPTTGRAGVLARAEAAARAASGAVPPSGAVGGNPAEPESEEQFAGRAPVAANSAYGLDPLDAATAGLGRARRLRMIQLGVLALGVVALIVGITLIATSLGR
ncbi:hypothetical protein E5206_10635 [Arthrobacter sp. PAMC25564]|uniref:hypothetical protein n=1 Tax=Arthrobacter sp. PAMC25564 TaxID=2565366 RepID=UPI0010A25B95|nr:hypothetical protein [Arthrobacter sp. PAMC25564]QCB97326.1 hypothetical protein E5206_10635 [Arthrobacter sp. PAMC25564]